MAFFLVILIHVLLAYIIFLSVPEIPIRSDISEAKSSFN